MNTLSLPPAPALRYPVGLIEPMHLPDGRQVLVRPVLPQDHAAEQAFVMHLSPASRYRRFHVGLRALPPALLQRMTEVDHRAHLALVAQPFGSPDTFDDDDGPGIVADVRYVQQDHHSAEFALAVADDWQHRGLGRQMLQRLARIAAKRGLRRLHGDVLSDNLPMIGLVQRLGGRLQPHEDGPELLRAVLDL